MKQRIVSQLKKVYSYNIKRLSKKNSQKALKSQVVYLLSFPNNDHNLIKKLSEHYLVTICFTKNMTHEASKLQETGLTVHNINSYTGLKETVKAVSESQIVIADNYFAFLGDIKKRHQQSFFQLWHATGAIKQFGLEDNQSKSRLKSDQERFKRVYDCFDYFVVASKAMGEVFQRSYGADPSQICYTGFPRTDYLFEVATKKNQTKEKVQLLYLPTYRNKESQQIVFDMIKLMEQLGTGYELKVKTHPHVDLSRNDSLKSFESIEILDSKVSADELLLEADILITDYSSVAFDYSLVKPNGKLIFYWYDEKEYQKEIGLQPNIKESLPSPICHSVEEVVSEVKGNEQDLTNFNDIWNTYNDGNATTRLLDKIAEKMDGHK